MPHHLENDQAFSIGNMLFDRPVAAGVLHVTALAFAKVVEHAFVVPLVVIAVRSAGFPRKCNHEGCVSWGRYAALSLAAKQPVNLTAPVVKGAYLIRKAHYFDVRICGRQVMAMLWERRLNQGMSLHAGSQKNPTLKVYQAAEKSSYDIALTDLRSWGPGRQRAAYGQASRADAHALSCCVCARTAGVTQT